jgi:hypothetical protein
MAKPGAVVACICCSTACCGALEAFGTVISDFETTWQAAVSAYSASPEFLLSFKPAPVTAAIIVAMCSRFMGISLRAIASPGLSLGLARCFCFRDAAALAGHFVPEQFSNFGADGGGTGDH